MEDPEVEKVEEPPTGSTGTLGGAPMRFDYVPGKNSEGYPDTFNYSDVIRDAPDNLTITDALAKCYSVVKNHEKIMASVSGGADSDIVIDLLIRCGGKDKTTFVFFDTGLEYEATKNQLKRLEEKYGIQIHRKKPEMPLPLAVRKYGQPFWSKRVSEYIYRLQKHGFKWEDEPFEVLIEKYPRCKSALKWWCNEFRTKNGTPSKFCISWVVGLKEFIIQNPPKHKISAKCCQKGKKELAKKFEKSDDFDCLVTGVRKAEGGDRSTAYDTCYTQSFAGADLYRPLWWFTNQDKKLYETHYNIEHSDCYTVWGMDRTGCAGCPFGKNFEQEQRSIQTYEPKFYKATQKIFGQSYDYTREFLAFRESQEKKTGEITEAEVEELRQICQQCERRNNA